MRIHPKEIQTVCALSEDQRYHYFIKKVSDWEEAWALYPNSPNLDPSCLQPWSAAVRDTGRKIFPLWPARPYAELCAQGECAHWVPQSLSIDQLIELILPELKKEQKSLEIFSTPTRPGKIVSIEQIDSDLKAELKNYL